MLQNHDKTQQLVRDQNLDALLITSTSNITYLTGYSGFSHVEREAYLLVTKQQVYLFTDGRYTTAVKTIQNIIVLEITSQTPLTSLLKTVIDNRHILNMGFEADNLTVTEYTKIKKTVKKLSPVKDIQNLRVVKTTDEIQKIQKACTIADKALQRILPKTKPGLTEKEVAWMLEKEIKETGAELSFPTIVAFGKNSAIPHHLTGDQKLITNNFVLVDFGVRYQNYCSDMTRTFFIGKPTEKQKKMYQAVPKAQTRAIEFLKYSIINHKSSHKPIKLSDVDHVVRNNIIEQGYPTIPHSLGHGIGIEIHEAPRLSPQSKDILEEGMVFSIEPGIYIPGFGGVRIEDLFAVQGNKLIQLTTFPKHFQIF